MNEVTPGAAADQSGAIGGTLRGRTWPRTMVLGATAGMVVGILNVLAVEFGWKLAGFFDVLDIPFLLLMGAVPGQLYFGPKVDADFYGPGFPVCYWTCIGWFAGSLICLVRAGVIVEMVRDHVCKYALFLGASAGMFIGNLNFLAALNQWDEWKWSFDRLDRPLVTVLDAFQARLRFLTLPVSGLKQDFVRWHVAVIIYWTAIGFLVASLFGVVWILRKRIAAGSTQMSGEVLPAE